MFPSKTKVIRLATVLGLLGTASFGAMAEWTEVGGTDEFTTYSDLSTIRRSGHTVKMWTMTDYNSAQSTSFGVYSSIRSRDEYDCSNERKRSIAISAHTGKMTDGSVLHVNDTVGQWRSVAPGSIGETFFKIACGIK